MGDRVVQLADITGDIGIPAMLDATAKEVRDGLRATTAVLVIAYRDGDETVTNVRCAGSARTISDAIGLLELAKLHLALEGPDG